MGFVYPQRDKELRGALGYHGRPMVRMNGQLPGLYPLLSAAFPNKLLGQGGRLPHCHHPCLSGGRAFFPIRPNPQHLGDFS